MTQLSSAVLPASASSRLAAGDPPPPCRLAYIPVCHPQPLEVSWADTARAGTINLVVMNPNAAGTPPIYCNEIDITIPIGNGANDLTANPPRVVSNTNKWTVGAGRRVRGEERGLPAGTQAMTFNCTCNSPDDFLINYPLMFAITASPVNGLPGDVPLIVAETSGNSPQPLDSRSGTFVVAKVLPPFFVRNFIASVPASGAQANQPSGQFANAAPIQLSWEGNASNYTVLAAPDLAPVYSGPNTSVILQPGLAQTTSFVLAAQLIAPDGQTEFRYATCTVKITNPDETPRSITATGNITTSGDLSTTGTGKLTVAGRSNLSSAHATGDVSVGGKLDVTGDATMANATVHAGLTVDGAANLHGALTVDGQTNLQFAKCAKNLQADSLNITTAAYIGWVSLGYPAGVQRWSIFTENDCLKFQHYNPESGKSMIWLIKPDGSTEVVIK